MSSNYNQHTTPLVNLRRPSEIIMQSPLPPCGEHSRALEFCCVTCEKGNLCHFICAYCAIVGRHKGHDILTIADLQDREYEKIIKVQTATNEAKNLFTAEEEAILHRKQEVSAYYQSVYDQISMAFEETINNLRNKRSEILSRVRWYEYKRLSKLQQHQNRLQTIIQQSQAVIDLITSAVNAISTGSTSLSMQHHNIDTLKALVSNHQIQTNQENITTHAGEILKLCEIESLQIESVQKVKDEICKLCASINVTDKSIVCAEKCVISGDGLQHCPSLPVTAHHSTTKLNEWANLLVNLKDERGCNIIEDCEVHISVRFAFTQNTQQRQQLARIESGPVSATNLSSAKSREKAEEEVMLLTKYKFQGNGKYEVWYKPDRSMGTIVDREIELLVDDEVIKRWKVVFQQNNSTNQVLSPYAKNPAAESALVRRVLNSTYTGRLSFEEISFGDLEATELAELMKVNTTVLHLHLCPHHRIGAAGATALACALKVNRTLKWIDLCGNPIGDAGAIALSEALKENSSLKLLGLERTSLTSSGVKALCTVLEENRNVTEVSLIGNSIDTEGKSAIEKLRTKRPITLHT